MGRYRKIDVRIWNDAKFRTLSDKGKLLFLFILTHPHLTSLGAMRATEEGMAAELAWEIKEFRKGYGELFRKGLINYDPEACFLGVPNFLKYNPPENPNVVKSWEKVVDFIPECQLKADLYEYVREFVKGLPEPFRKGMPKEFERVCQYPSPSPSPSPRKDTPPTPSRGPSFSPQLLAELWNEKAPPELPKISLPFKRKPKDLDKIKDALKRNPEKEWWLRVILLLHDLPFVKGFNDRGWKITLDVMVRDAEKILDGKYS